MISSATNPEVPVPEVETEKSQETSNVENRFQTSRERFGGVVNQLKASLLKLRQIHPDINLDAETSQFDEQTEKLNHLSEQVSAQLREGIEEPTEIRKALEIDDLREEETRVKQFIEEKGVSGGDTGLFKDRWHETENWQQSVQKQLEHRSISDRLKRAYLLSGLKRAGVQNSDQLLSTLEHNISINNYSHLTSSNLVNLMLRLDGESGENALEKLNRALERFQKLHLLPSSLDIQSQDFPDAVLLLADIPDEIVQTVIDNISKYDFLYTQHNISYGDGINPEVQMRLDIIRQGGLTSQQKELLDREQIYFSLTGQAPITNTSDKQFPYFVYLHDALQPQTQYLDEFYPYLIDYATSRIEGKYSGGHIIYGSFLEGLMKLRIQGRLSDLGQLAASGWDCTNLYAGLNTSYGAPTREQIPEILTRALDFSADPEKVAWIQQLQQEIEEYPLLLVARIDAYEAMYKERDKVEEFMTVLRALPMDKVIRLSDIGGLSDGKLVIKYDLIRQRLERISGNRDIPQEKRAYAELMASLLYNTPEMRNMPAYTHLPFREEDMPLFTYIASQKNNLAELAPYNRPTAKLIEGALNAGIEVESEVFKSLLRLCNDVQNLPPTFTWEHLSLFEHRISTIIDNLPEDFIKTLSPEDQYLIPVLKFVHPYAQTFLLENRDKVAELIVDGRPKADFFDLLVSKRVYAVDQFLSDDVLSSFTPDEKQFWQTFMSFRTGARAFLFANKNNYQEFVVDGKPTEILINEVSKSTPGQVPPELNDILDRADIESFPPLDREFWSFYKSSQSQSEMQAFLLRVRDKFSSIVTEGKPTPRFLHEACSMHNPALEVQAFNIIDWNSYPGERPFWEYYRKSPYQFKPFILNHESEFGEFVVDGQETAQFFRALIVDDPRVFVGNATREQWRIVFGEDIVNQFLDALPSQTDEKRNAFTHNEYDRTSAFIDYLIMNGPYDFSLNRQDMEVLTEYVKQFGLSRTPVLFHYFKNLYLFEEKKLAELPHDVEESGIRSIKEIVDQLTKIRAMVYSVNPMKDLSKLSEFEVEMLQFITGKSTHRWGSGSRSIEQIIRDFQSDIESGSIEGLPEGYHVEVLSASNIRIEFNADAIREDYDILKDEILAGIQNPNNADSLKGSVLDALQRKISEIEQVVSQSEGKKREFMMREISRFEGYVSALEKKQSLDSLMENLLDMNFDKTEQKIINSVFRRIIFGKIFQKHFSPHFIQETQRQLEGDISAASIESILNIVDEMAKTHALNIDGNNKEGYWAEEAFAKIKGSKRGRDLTNSFSPHIGKLREEVEKFQMIQVRGNNQVRAIPDRGFVGEMSGYLADACYTAEYPLLKRYPNVIPYKFVSLNPETGEPQFLGSVLVFELNDEEGSPSLLARAFDIPQESSVDINSFIEQFLDKLVDVGRARGMRRILVPGNSGAISNYHMTINHMRENYTINKEPVSLAENFSFNGYNLTNDCYVAREIV